MLPSKRAASESIDRICRRFATPIERRCVRAFLLRAVFEVTWKTVGHKMGISPQQAFNLGKRGRELLDDAKRPGGPLAAEKRQDVERELLEG